MSVAHAVTSGGGKLTFPPRAFSCFSSSQQLHYDHSHPREIIYYICDTHIFVAAHNKAVHGRLQISAAGVKMNDEEVFEQCLDMEEQSDECDCSSES